MLGSLESTCLHCGAIAEVACWRRCAVCGSRDIQLSGKPDYTIGADVDSDSGQPSDPSQYGEPGSDLRMVVEFANQLIEGSNKGHLEVTSSGGVVVATWSIYDGPKLAGRAGSVRDAIDALRQQITIAGEWR